jgi:hypothetical protein
MHTRKDMTRAVFESTGFIDLDIIEATRNGSRYTNLYDYLEDWLE